MPIVARYTPGAEPAFEAAGPAHRAAGLTLCFGGYLSNRAELRRAARQRGADPVTDADLLALAYRWWGEALPRHVLGQFALVVHDPAAGRVVLVHDELGLAPLFHARHGGAFLIAAHIEDLVAITGRRDIDEDYVADHLARGLATGRRTPFAGITRLAPGESLTIGADGRVRGHDVGVLGRVEAVRPRRPGDVDEEFRQLLREAVSGALPSEGKVWCELSGGLDSSTVLSVTQDLGRPVEALSLVYPRSHVADESRWIRAVLHRHPVPWHAIDADALRPFTGLPEGFVAEPTDRLVTGPLRAAYDAAVREAGVAAVLTGQGGDAVFFGDGVGPLFLADLLRRGRFADLGRGIAGWARDAEVRRPFAYWLSAFAVKPWLRHLRGLAVEDHFHAVPPAPWIAPAYAGRMRLAARRRGGEAAPGCSVATAAFTERLRAVTAGFTRHNHHRSSNLPFRHPLLHRPLIAFMLALPPEQQFGAGADRILQRRALAGLLPDATVRRRDKGGGDQAFYEGLESSRQWRTLLTDAPRIVERGYVDAAAWRTAVEQACLGRTSSFGDFLATANLETWLRQLDQPIDLPAPDWRAEPAARPREGAMQD